MPVWVWVCVRGWTCIACWACQGSTLVTRREKLLVLLWSRSDFDYAPRSNLRTASGLTPGERVVCPDCGSGERPGVRLDRFKREVPCETCGGRIAAPGVRAKRGRGFVTVDGMDSELRPLRVERGDVPTRAAGSKLCDGCGGSGVGGAHLDEDGREFRDACRVCGGSGRRVVASFDLALDREVSDSDTRLEDAIEKREASGSYRELDRALADLKAAWPSLHRAVVDALVLGDPDALKLGLVEKAAVPFLLARMPEPIRVSGQVVKAWKAAKERRALAVGRGAGGVAIERRDKEIRTLVRQGKPTQWVAAEYGLTPARVNQITYPDRHAA